MSAHTTRVNRTALIIVGLILAAAGAAGLVLSLGGFGEDVAADPVLSDSLRDLAKDSAWFWPALAVVCLLLAYLGWRLLLAQVRIDRHGPLDLTENPRDGTTTLDSPAVARALTEEVEELPGVSGAVAHLRRRGGSHVDLVVELTRRADVARIRNQLETEIVPRLRQALDDPELPVTIQLRPGRDASRDLT